MKETKTFKKLNTLKKNNSPKWLIVHHTGGTETNPLADTSHHTAQIAENWHLQKGWDGLGYHYFIHKDGEIWKGRPEHRNGAHARGYNTKSIGICMAGNFDVTLPTEKQRLSLQGLLNDLSSKYSIQKENIIPHRNVANKTCYGNKLSEDWARSLIEEKTLSQATIKELVDEILRRIRN